MSALEPFTCAGGVHDGDVLLQSRADIERLRDCTRINGNLTITTLTLEDLRGLESLTSIDKDLLIAPAPQTTSDPAARIDPRYSTKSALLRLAGLDNLERVHSLNLQGLTQLTDVTGLARLRAIRGILRVRQCDSLRDLLGLRSLGAVAELTVENNARLQTLLGQTLTTFPSAIWLFDNPSLEHPTGLVGAQRVERLSLKALPALTQLTDLHGLTTALVATIDNCGSLKDLSGLEQLTTVSVFTLRDCAKLESLNGLTNLSKVDDGFYLNDLPALQSLRGVDNLQRASRLDVSGTAALPSLEGLENVWDVSTLTLIANQALTSLRGIEAVKGGAQLRIERNSQLPQCEIRRLATRLRVPEPEPSNGNGPEGTCE